MNSELTILLVTAFSIGFIHTLIGPDHYLPFIVMARARKWSLNKTLFITVLCGIGHVLGSVIIGLIGVAGGLAVGLLENVESVRGNIASWVLIGVGFAYGIWGLRVAWRSREHTHTHLHDDTEHTHPHTHSHLGRHVHLHGNTKSITPWALFIVFVLGPCEPLIPILMYPAAAGHWSNLIWVTLAFGVTTISTMTIIVAVATKGLMNFRLGFLEKYVHVLAGGIIALSGLAIKAFGL
ncbi:MAG: sulfite exporter TauE/SafE family protein [Candidatus Marinimicrobia bacterium]|nr:sulfite exporter TauE/SafE family protein [Candidatus Neomarinimicrobiota bacterium]MCF7840417.1 sulfite exporter TauE/SafE family protein [Candidatus Neomarinimicrobiota bacterium]